MKQHYTVWPPNGTIYLDPAAAPGPVYPILVENRILDLEVCDLVNGVVVEKAEKKEAKASRIAAENEANRLRDEAEKAAALEMEAISKKTTITAAERDRAVLFLLRRAVGK